MIECLSLSILHDSGKGIHDIDLLIPEGGSFALVGASGCGKTTLLHGIAGWLQAESGSVVLSGGSNPRLGIVTQEDALFPWLTAAGNAALGLKGKLKDHKQALTEIFLSIGLEPDTLDRYPGQLSGGQRQRVALARTMACRPEILLLDEPTASLDPFTKESMQDLLLELHIRKPVTTFMVTHSIEEALFLGESVLIMNEGRIIKTIANPLFPDPEARVHKRFYELIMEIRSDFRKVTQ